jgi:hypothetical protein
MAPAAVTTPTHPLHFVFSNSAKVAQEFGSIWMHNDLAANR